MKKSETQIENFSLLLKAARQNDQMAIDALWERVKAKPLKIARKRVAKRYLGEDAENELAEPLAAAIHKRELVTEEDFVKYLCAAAKYHINHLLMRTLYRCKAECQMEPDYDFWTESYCPEVDKEFLFEEIRKLLSEKQFQVFYLVAMQDLTVTEVARRLGLSRKNASKHFNGAREILKSSLLIKELQGSYKKNQGCK